MDPEFSEDITGLNIESSEEFQVRPVHLQEALRLSFNKSKLMTECIC